MNSKRLYLIVVGLLALAVVLAACQAEPETVEVTRVVTEIQEVEKEVPVEVEVEVTRVVTEVTTETVTEIVEVEKAPIGSAERPIQVLFVPSAEAEVILAGGELMDEVLTQVTGLEYEVSVPTSYAATIESMCASPEDTIGFIPALGYVIANERCGVIAGLAAVRFGWPVYWAQFIVRDDSGIESLEDFAGKTWGVPSVTSTSGFLVPQAMLVDAGIEPSEIVEHGGSHTSAMLAVAQGDVDFATGYFSPPLLPNFERNWNPATDDPEIWRDAGENPVRTDAGRVYVAGGPEEGGYRVLDARTAAFETYPTILEETNILQISDEIPNDTMSYGSEFPLGLAEEIAAAVKAYAESDECQSPPEGTLTFCSDEFYTWTGAERALDSMFDPTRFLVKALGMTEEDILGE